MHGPINIRFYRHAECHIQYESKFHNHRSHKMKCHTQNNELEWTWRTTAEAEDNVPFHYDVCPERLSKNCQIPSPVGVLKSGLPQYDQNAINYPPSYSWKLWNAPQCTSTIVAFKLSTILVKTVCLNNVLHVRFGISHGYECQYYVLLKYDSVFFQHWVHSLPRIWRQTTNPTRGVKFQMTIILHVLYEIRIL